jgi:hypothetical protein
MLPIVVIFTVKNHNILKRNMIPNPKYAILASDEVIQKTAKALEQNGISAKIVNSVDEARQAVLDLVPEGSEVFTMTSMTLEALGIPKIINESGKYQSIRAKLNGMDRKTQRLEMNRLGSAPEIALGSVHAVTQGGQLMIASNTGSQLAAYATGALKVIWVVGAQKIVKDLEDGFKRLYEYSLPLEDVRAQKAYGMHSNVSKILIINKEVAPNRAQVILVKQKLGF